MKPDRAVARRSDYSIEVCPHREASAFIAAHHYARGTANTSVAAHCLRRRDTGEVVGAALWMPPTPKAARSVSPNAHTGVLALSRLAVREGEPQNAATLLLGASMRLIGRDPRWHTALTYADTRHGHTGAIYRATNWEYLGRQKGGEAWLDPATGKQVAKKATRSRTVAEMLARGYRKLSPSEKHKFIYRLRKVP